MKKPPQNNTGVLAYNIIKKETPAQMFSCEFAKF